jgi:hypothetical protein
MKHRRPTIAFTQKRKRRSIIGEWTKASHKRLLVEEYQTKQFSRDKLSDD